MAWKQGRDQQINQFVGYLLTWNHIVLESYCLYCIWARTGKNWLTLYFCSDLRILSYSCETEEYDEFNNFILDYGEFNNCILDYGEFNNCILDSGKCVLGLGNTIIVISFTWIRLYTK